MLIPASPKADAGSSKKTAKPAADDGGCAIASQPGRSNVSGTVGMFALGLAVLSLRRRR